MNKSWEWCCKIQPAINKSILPREEVLDNPLKSNVVVVSESKGASRRGGSTVTSTGSSTPTPPVLDPLTVALDGTDPLSQFAASQDPLSVMATESWDREDKKSSKKVERYSDIEPWAVRKTSILSKFTTSEKLSMVSSFLSGGEKVVVKTQSSAVKTRLEQLDDFEEGSVREEADLSQQEYAGRIDQLNKELVQAWNDDQRVKALKIAIQCSKLLVDTSVIQFYPSKFVLITDILDIFGQLVYNRLLVKSENTVPIRQGARNLSLPENFSPEMVPESAKETCRNWFYKIASIRELVPRLYVEAAILRCYSFLDKGELVQALLRLTRMVRGIGDPLVAVYARCYLCRVGMTVHNIEKQLLKENFYDFLSCYHQVFSGNVQVDLLHQKVDLPTYLTLYTPALDWILQSLAHQAPDKLLDEILARCKDQGNSSLLLNSIMSAFKPAYIASRASLFVQLIAVCDEQGFPQHLLYRSLGLCLSIAEPDSPSQLWSHVWHYLTSLHNPHHYMSCAEVWLPFVAQHFSSFEVDVFLQDIIQHLSRDRAYENFYPQLQHMAGKLLTLTTELESLFTMEKFMPFVDMIRNEGVKVAICKNIMVEFTAKMGPVNDPVTTNALMSICQIMHDSVNALTVEDEKRQISQLIAQLVLRVDHGRDFEQQLSFYVEARAAFSNLDYVHAILVQCVNRLAVETNHVVKGHHTRKTSAFVRACAAFCYITIPSIFSVTTRLQLYLLTAQVALSNQCLGQVDGCLKDALSLVPEVPSQLEVDGKMKSSEQFLVSYFCQLLSTLLVVPDSPEQGVLYLIRGLLNVLQHYTWDNSSCARAQVYLRALDMLSIAAQETYPYHVKKVDSNDVLYGSDPKFIAEINKMCSLIVEEVLNQLKVLGAAESYQNQAILALDLFMAVMVRGDLSSQGLATLAVNLWNLANKHRQIDSKRLKRTLECLKRRSSAQPDNIYSEVLAKLELP
ncbi:VPS35 endosomal protein-sorting factor-like [Macrosteles quadrilineatus]|uniref:VPS35 endosomal protein-sorting factor-like n=1 Tax=Macrosteles quadrilineatus TaxID=74068 RepID=UPI0023E3210E|nr:VPS35 endosomal protein-sorting factor-like [Macrosteles quadrilineatus]